MTNRTLLIVVAIVVVVGLGLLFRPDRLFTNKTVNEALPAASPVTTVLSGQFHDGAHQTSGTATIYRLDDGQEILRLADLDTSNGPDLYVYLVAASDAPDDDAVKNAEHIDLGALKGNRGNQNYDVPSSVDLAKYRAVAIWCRTFSVNFGAAPLTQQ
jgi:hypothetical protein